MRSMGAGRREDRASNRWPRGEEILQYIDTWCVCMDPGKTSAIYIQVSSLLFSCLKESIHDNRSNREVLILTCTARIYNE